MIGNFWVIFVKIGLLCIPTSAHTGGTKERKKTILPSNLFVYDVVLCWISIPKGWGLSLGFFVHMQSAIKALVIKR